MLPGGIRLSIGRAVPWHSIVGELRAIRLNLEGPNQAFFAPKSEPPPAYHPPFGAPLGDRRRLKKSLIKSAGGTSALANNITFITSFRKQKTKPPWFWRLVRGHPPLARIAPATRTKEALMDVHGVRTRPRERHGSAYNITSSVALGKENAVHAQFCAQTAIAPIVVLGRRSAR